MYLFGTQLSSWVYCILKGDGSSWNFIYFCTPSVQKKQFGFMVRASFAFLLLYLIPFAFKQQIASIAILHPVYEQDHRNNHLLFTYFQTQALALHQLLLWLETASCHHRSTECETSELSLFFLAHTRFLSACLRDAMSRKPAVTSGFFQLILYLIMCR